MSVIVTAEQPALARLPVFNICLLILMAVIDSQVVAAIAPRIAAGLAVTGRAVASSVTIYSISAAVVALWLVKYRIRPGAGLPIAAALFVVGGIIATLSPHIAVFFVARAIAGAAGGLISALAIAALADASSYAKRGNQMSGVAICYFLAPVLGVPLATFVTGSYSWRVIFLMTALPAIIAGLLVYQFPLPSATEGVRGDAPRATLWQLISRSRSTMMGVLGAFFVSGGLVGFTTYLGSWLVDAFQAQPRQVGLIYALAGGGAVVGGALGGMLADRYGKRRIALASSAGMSLLLLVLPTFTWSVTLFALIGITALLAALRVAPLHALVSELVEPAERAPYIALRNTASQLGIATAVAASARLYGSFGLVGVGACCALLTVCAWLSVRALADPQAKNSNTRPTLTRRALTGTAVLALIVLIGLPLAASVLITKAYTRPDERVRTDTPAALGAQFEEVAFTSIDGNRLSGWYLPARGTQATIVMTHGLFRSRYELLDRGVALWRQGYGVLLYDLRRHGRSPAEFSSLGYRERNDVLAAINYMREREPDRAIVAMGVSMGAAATLLAAAESGAVSAVIAESSFLSFRDVVAHHVGLAGLPQFPFAHLLVSATALRMNFAPAQFDVRAAVQKIERPILFIGAGADRRMPTSSVLEPLYEAARHPHKRKIVIEGAAHGQAYTAAPERYLGAVEEFLRANENAR